MDDIEKQALAQFLVSILPRGSKWCLVVLSNPNDTFTEGDLDIASTEVNYKPILELAINPPLVPADGAN